MQFLQMIMSMIKKTSPLEREIGYTFKDKHLLKEALSHSSTKELSNERLEFLGDAVLELIVSEHIFTHADFDEGDMSQKRSLIVKKESLSEVSRQMKLSDYMYFGKSEILAGGKDKPSILANVFEALLGSVYLDGGYLRAKQLVFKYLGEKISQTIKSPVIYDYKAAINEQLKRQGTDSFFYKVVKEEGPQHDKQYFVELISKGRTYGCGSGKTKKAAEQDSARDALENILKGRKYD